MADKVNDVEKAVKSAPAPAEPTPPTGIAPVKTAAEPVKVEKAAEETPAIVKAKPQAAPAKVVAPVVVEPVAAKSVAAKATAVPAKPVIAKPVLATAVTKKAAPAIKPVVAKPVSLKTAPAASSPVLEGKIAMSTTIPTSPQAVAEKVQTMFTQLNDRAKAAMEKGAKVGEELTEFTKGNVEAFVTSAKTAAKGAETMGAEVADYSKKSFESASAAMKSMTTVKSPAELFQLQSEYAKASFDGAVSEVSKLSEAWLKLAGDVFQPLSTRYSLAAEKIKSAASL